MVRRIALGGVVLLVVVVVLGVMFVGHAAGTVELRKQGPVRDAFQARRQKADEAIRQAIVESAAWDDLGEPVPASIGCRLVWDSARDDAVIAHERRCGASAALPATLVKELQSVTLTQQGEFASPSMAWMKELRGRANWLELQGTPLELVVPDPSRRTIGEMPTLDCGHAVALSKLALVQASRANALDEGITDVLAFSKALLGMPLTGANVCGISVLKSARSLLSAAGQSTERLPTEEALARLQTARLAVGTLWNPWVPASSRALITPSLTPLGQCLSAMEGLLYADMRPVIERRYPDWNPSFIDEPACKTRVFTAVAPAHGRGAAWPRALLQSERFEAPGVVLDTASMVVLRLSGTRREGRLEQYLARIAASIERQ